MLEHSEEPDCEPETSGRPCPPALGILVVRQFFVGWLKTTATISVGIALTLGAILLFGSSDEPRSHDRAAPGPTVTRTVTVSPTESDARPSATASSDSRSPNGSTGASKAPSGEKAEPAAEKESSESKSGSSQGTDRSDSHTSRNSSKPTSPGSGGSSSRPTSSPGQSEPPSTNSPRLYAQATLSAGQYDCLDTVAQRESGWDPTATNPSSGAYGIGQALPGSKMASAGSDWQTNGVTQVKWMIDYADDRYGSPCAALSFHNANGYY